MAFWSSVALPSTLSPWIQAQVDETHVLVLYLSTTKFIKNIYLYSLYTSKHYRQADIFNQVDNQSKLNTPQTSLRNHRVPRTAKLDPPFTSLPCLPNPYCNEHRKRLVIIGSSRIIAELGFLSVRYSNFIHYSPLPNVQRYHATS
jgi:hypothetical protein